MSRFLIGIVGLGTNPHAECFTDMARALAAALRDLGHEVEYASPGAKPGRIIAFGANNLIDDGNIPEDMIVFNSEQLAAVADPKFFLQNWLGYKKHVVWDYSRANFARLLDLGLERAALCPVGYHPSMTSIEPAAEEDIDVLFYGSVAGPRREILDALDDSGIKVTRLFGVYGAERDRAIARAKVVLNLHFYPSGVFEIFRVSHLLANRKCVVTEAGGCDDELEAFAKKTCVYAPREDIVEQCRLLVANAAVRRDVAELGYEEFKQISLVDSVRGALEASA